jgi:L-ribulose-5-phosphate 4-epimerase
VKSPADEPEDGVIKFSAEHEDVPLPEARHAALAAALVAWRAIFAHLGAIGQAAHRYGGVGFGNVSGRLGPFPGAPGARPFLITGTQTGGRDCLTLADFCVVERWSVRRNSVRSHGAILPSSESMTHGAIYDLGPHVRFVFHGHCPTLWRAARALRLPTTDPRVAYGTTAMATEVGRLYRETSLAEGRVLAMGGHEDGIIAFGRTPEEAGSAFTEALARAYAQAYLDAGRLCRV